MSCASEVSMSSNGPGVIKLEFILKLKIKRHDICPQAPNHCAFLNLRLYSSFITSGPGHASIRPLYGTALYILYGVTCILF